MELLKSNKIKILFYLPGHLRCSSSSVVKTEGKRILLICGNINSAKANLKAAESLYSINFHNLFHGNNSGSIVITSDEPKSI